MARIARLVVLGLAHHVTQRGNRREQVFFQELRLQFTLSLINSNESIVIASSPHQSICPALWLRAFGHCKR